MQSDLLINEIYGPVEQGEGKSVGMPCIFLRLATCNLHCKWCDTPYSWDWSRYDKNAEISRMNINEVFEFISTVSKLNPKRTPIKNLVVTGGEPMMQAKQLQPLLALLKSENVMDWIEIETNGTIAIDRSIDAIDQINCSPKLSNSGEPERMRLRPKVLAQYVSDPRVNFKFVVGSAADVSEVIMLVHLYGMKNVYLMPLGKTQEEIITRSPFVRDLASSCGYNFSPRIHIEKHGDVRGV